MRRREENMPSIRRSAGLLSILLLVSLMLAACGGPGGTLSPTVSASASTEHVFVADGEMTALELTEQSTSVTYLGDGEMAFVVEVDGVKADDSKKEFWALYFNGEMAQVGAGALALAAGDEIRWRLETYE